MNYHSDKWVMEQINKHNDFAHTLYDPSLIVGVFCQGSTNYGLDTPNSDIDTKCIVLPSFKNICLAQKPVSTTHVLDNNEHLDAKDIRSYVICFRKQNLNFLEILFTPYVVINPMYEKQWKRLIDNRERIARMNEFRAVKSMKGIALEKFHAMKHKYPTKLDIIEKYGYDGKQVHHLLRVDDYLTRYIAGEDYESCLHPTGDLVPRLMDYKRLSVIPLAEAEEEAEKVLAHAVAIADAFCAEREDQEDEEMRALLEDVSYSIMKISVEKELQK